MEKFKERTRDYDLLDKQYEYLEDQTLYHDILDIDFQDKSLESVNEMKEYIVADKVLDSIKSEYEDSKQKITR